MILPTDGSDEVRYTGIQFRELDAVLLREQTNRADAWEAEAARLREALGAVGRLLRVFGGERARVASRALDLIDAALDPKEDPK